MNALDFDEYRPEYPTNEAIGAAVEAALERFEAAGSGREAVEAIAAWDKTMRTLETLQDLSYIRFTQDTRDADAKALRTWVDESTPGWTELGTRFKAAVSQSPYRREVEEHYGGYVFELWAKEQASFDPAIKDDLAKEAKLVSRYTALLGSAEFELKGQTLNLGGIMKFTEDPDRSTRHEANRLLWGWAADRGQELDDIYDEMVKLRHGMALKLGLEDFVALGYQRMKRMGYGKDEVAIFRREVLEKITPLVGKLRGLQAERLGLDKVMAWDASLYNAGGNPAPLHGEGWMLDQASKMFDQFDPGLGAFFGQMREKNLLDLGTREGKAPGGYCAFLPDFEMPFIYANFNGTSNDVRVFTHEIGHAFQSWSGRDAKLCGLIWPTSDGAEIHSMSLEFLTWPFMDLFFGDRAQDFRWNHLAGSMAFMPTGVLGDHFQEMVYSNPDASARDRHEMWAQLERLYTPDKDWGDLDFPASGRRWQLIPHIYHTPFYLLDYVLALTCALQFWHLSQRDEAEALRRYISICELGGQVPFKEIVAHAGFHSPFERGCLDGIVKSMEAEIF